MKVYQERCFSIRVVALEKQKSLLINCLWNKTGSEESVKMPRFLDLTTGNAVVYQKEE